MAFDLPEGFADWPLDQKQAYAKNLKYNWDLWARPNQKLPSLDLPWNVWMILSGRGWGKTRTGAEAIKRLMLDYPGCRIGIIGQTAGAVRDVCLEGESGLLSVIPSEMYVRGGGGKYNRSLGQLTLSNGSMAFSFSGADPEKLRGFQSNYLWLDEICAYQYAQETWDMAVLGLRLGKDPRIIVTTTPKPSPLIVELVRRAAEEPESVILSTGSTFDNAANLPAGQLDELRRRYEGTTMGRQELYAELILDDPGALWKRDLIEELRISIHDFDLNNMARLVVAIDPSMSSVTERDSETGMIIAGLGRNGHGYIIEDCSALRPSPDTWGNLAIAKYHQYAADRIVAEVNQGYDLVVNLLNTKDDRVPVKKVYATRGGKFLRAEPVAALYEQCVARGMLVSTDRGQVPIELITEQDRVWTRRGLRSVLWSGRTGHMPTVKIEAGERELICTSNHPVFVVGRGFVSGALVVPSDRLLSWEESNESTHAQTAAEKQPSQMFDASRAAQSSVGRPDSPNVNSSCLNPSGTSNNLTGTIERLVTQEMNCYTEHVGNLLSALLKRDGTCTTRMKIPVTTNSETLLRCLLGSISANTGDHRLKRLCSEALRHIESGGQNESIQNTFATGAKRFSTLVQPVSDFARPSATQAIGIIRNTWQQSQDVYNLRVDGEEEFFANSILVHNCRVHHVGLHGKLEDQMTQWIPGKASPDRLDAMVWAITDLMLGGGVAEWFSPLNLPRLPSVLGRKAIQH